MTTIKKLQREAHDIATGKGWWEGSAPNIAEKLCLIHSEISEALEEMRSGATLKYTYQLNGKPEGFPIELADAVIRIMDLCGYLDIDLEAAIKLKMEYNETRPYRHGGKQC